MDAADQRCPNVSSKEKWLNGRRCPGLHQIVVSSLEREIYSETFADHVVEFGLKAVTLKCVLSSVSFWKDIAPLSPKSFTNHLKNEIPRACDGEPQL